MGMGGAPWLVRPERESEEAPDAALDAIGIAKGATVADIGAGVGYFTWRLAARVGPPEKSMRWIFSKACSTNSAGTWPCANSRITKPSWARKTIHISCGRIDLALLVDVYHEFSHPQKMLHRIRAALAPDGRMVLLEYRKEDPQVPILPAHKMSVAEVKAEIEPEGFRLEKTLENLPRQHILIFRKNTM